MSPIQTPGVSETPGVSGPTLAAPVSGASQARAPVQIRPRGRGLGAFQRSRLAKN